MLQIYHQQGLRRIVHLFMLLTLLTILMIGQPLGALSVANAAAANLLACTNVTTIPQAECTALVAFYDSTNGAGWTDNTGWLVNSDPCTWVRVTCAAGHVSQLDFYGNQLHGSLPSELGNLVNLQRLDLSGNQLNGPIPGELSNLVNLQILDLGANQLTGDIPVALGNLITLQKLNLFSNHLSGTIPTTLGNLVNLHVLILGTNQLSGTIPLELGNLTNLQTLDLSSNQLSGNIPPILGNLAILQQLFLGQNQLIGNIPATLGNLTNLEFLTLDSNQLSGNVPARLCNASLIVGAALGYNKLNTADPCLDTKAPNWAQTQTVPPTTIHVTGVSASSVSLAWTTIAYTADAGYYEVLHASTHGGPYTSVGQTSDKVATQFTINNVAGGAHYFVVRTITPQHGFQQNDLTSDNSSEVVVFITQSANPCAAGSYFNGTACIPAPHGYYVPSAGATAAIPCAPGSYQDLSGQSSCKTASPGTYSDIAGATVANACPIGFYQDQAGQTSCIPALTGYFVDASGAVAATHCAVGFYQDLTGQSSCKAAPPGTYVSIVGASTSIPCAVGSYQDLTGQSSCKAAPVDTFVALTGAVTPTVCPTDTYQDQVGQAFCLPLPTIGTLSPATVPVGSDAFILTVNGANFPSGAQILWNGAALATTYGSAAQLTATVPQANVPTGGAVSITVIKPPSLRQSAPQPFTVTSNQPPVITIVLDAQPNSVTNFKFTGGLGTFSLDDIKPADKDAYSNSQSFTVAPGAYTVTELTVSGWLVTAITCTPAENGVVALPNRQVTINATLGDTITCTFVIQRAGQLMASVYDDRNHNGVRNNKENGLSGWQLELFTGTGGALGNQSTNPKGSTTFTSLTPGTYTICETLPAGWFNITPNILDTTFGKPCYTVTVAPGQMVAVSFGNSTSPLAAAAEAGEFDNVIVMDLPDIDDDGNLITPLPDPWPDVVEEQSHAIFLPLVTR